MKQTTNYNEVPECCKRCVFKKYDPFNYGNYSCLKNIHLPTKKQQCKKHKLTKKYRFIKFLKDEKIYNDYILSVRYIYGINHKIKNPHDYIPDPLIILSKFVSFPPWIDINKKWLEIIRKEYGV